MTGAPSIAAICGVDEGIRAGSNSERNYYLKLLALPMVEAAAPWDGIQTTHPDVRDPSQRVDGIGTKGGGGAPGAPLPDGGGALGSGGGNGVEKGYAGGIGW